MSILKRMTVDYSELKDHLQTGDVVLMKGMYLSSHTIEFIEHNDWSHAAIVVLARDIDFDSDDPILLWESNIKQEKRKFKDEKVIDLLTGDEKDGPQLVSLLERMKMNYKHKEDGKFAIRNLYTDRTPEMYTKLKETINKYKDAGFPSSKEEFLYPIEGRYKGFDAPKDKIFCSELVSLTYQALGLLSTMHPANAYVPADYSDANSVSLLKRAWLGQEIIIDPKSLV